MSLLLDALKKAADDKKKISDGELAAKKSQSNKPVASHTASSDSVCADEAGKDEKVKEEEVATESDFVIEETLTLEDTIEDEALGLTEEEEGAGLDEIELTLDEEETIIDPPSASEKFVISDDALSLLIHKTNRDIKKNNKILIGGIATVTLLILVAGGVFYYSDMQAEIASLERKHGIAMQAMRSKTNSNRLPDNSDIIRNLVSDTDLDKKVQFAKQHLADDNNAPKRSPQKNVSEKKLSTAAPVLSIQKTNKIDPVGEALNAAWLSYERGQYDDARESYEKVLSMEAGNRDALLGLGAISVINKNNVKARGIYASLLELDPRDPIATAAIASLRSDEGSRESDERYLLSMLQKNSEAPHLNFSLANIYAQQDKWVSAQQYYFNAWQQDSENADYIFNLAVSLDQLNKKQQALKFYKDSLSKAKNKQISFSREAVQKRITDLTEL